MPEPQSAIPIKGDRLTLRGPIYGRVIGFGEPVKIRSSGPRRTRRVNVPKALELTVLAAQTKPTPNHL